LGVPLERSPPGKRESTGESSSGRSIPFKDESAALKVITALRKDINIKDININDRRLRTKPLKTRGTGRHDWQKSISPTCFSLRSNCHAEWRTNHNKTQDIEGLRGYWHSCPSPPEHPALRVETELVEFVQVAGQTGHNLVFRAFDNF
jgi:hypothetical protein